MSKPMPNRVDSESYVLGCALNSHRAVDQLMELLSVDVFMNIENKRIFSAMERLYNQDARVTPTTVAAEIEEVEPGKSDLQILYAYREQGHESDISYYAKNIVAAYKQRRLIQLYREGIREITDKDKSFEEVNSMITTEVDALTLQSSNQVQDIKTILKEDFMGSGMSLLDYMDMMKGRREKGENTLIGIPTSYPKLDQAINGLCPGHFIVIGARPAMGKTTFIINLLHNLLKQDKKVCLFSYEMTSPEVVVALIAKHKSINMREALKGMFGDGDRAEIAAAIEEFTSQKWMENLVVDDDSSANNLQIRAKMKRYAKSQGTDVFFVDYLTQINGSKNYGTRQEEVQDVSQTLTHTAKELKIPVVCVAQLNRKNEQDNRPPRKSDLRESGQIEQDAHTLIMIHREPTGIPNEYSNMIQLHIVKNRFGETKRIDLEADFQKSTLVECEDLKKVLMEANEIL